MALTNDARPSVLGSLRQRREELIQDQVLELPVPRWESPKIVVQYKPVDYPAVNRALTRIQEAKKAARGDVELDANADVLINACVGIFALIDGKKHALREDEDSPDLPRFGDPDLASALGLPEGATARLVARTLFLTDGDLIQHSSRVMEWSGFATTEAEEALAGEA